MMKGKSKKLVAWLLALTLLASPSAGIRVFADEADGTGQDAAVTVDNASGNTEDGAAATDQNAPTADPATTDTPVAGDTAVPDGSLPADDSSAASEPAADDPSASGEPAADAPSAAGETDGAEGQETEDPAVEDGGLINFVMVEQQVLQAPGEQNVIISFGDGSEQLASVMLVLAGSDGRQSEIPLTQKVYSYYQFVKNYGIQEAGDYRLAAFTYELDGEQKRIDFADKAGIGSEFTVLSDAADESDAEPSVDVTATTSDDISDDMTNEIQSAIQEAADEAVEEIVNGAVALGASSTDKAYSRAGVSAELTAATDKAVKLGSYSAAAAYTGTPSAMVVVLDPGHGGSDPGSSGNGLVESELNLKVAKYCKAALEKGDGIKVYMTRTSDKYLGLEERVKIAKSYKADLFVSIHMNSSTKKEAHGAEVYYPNKNYNSSVHEEGKAVANNILRELESLGLYGRGVKDQIAEEGDSEPTYPDGSAADNLSVIRNCKKEGIPGILVEHAFISNTEDAANLKTEEFLKKLGEADAKGILKCYDIELDVSAVYNYDYYINKYSSELRNDGVNKNDKEAVKNYFLNYGMSQGHQASEEFNVFAYRERYQDLRAAFGSNYKSYYLHYINYGKAEGRNAKENNSSDSDRNQNSNADAILDGVNYVDVYDYEYYIEKYPDLKAAFSNNKKAALEHFVMFGMSEGRQAKGTFDVGNYKSRYPDLQKAFGSSLKSYYLHYINYGKKEGRVAVKGETEAGSTDTGETGTAVYRGVDFSPIYNFAYYVEKYPDIKNAFGNDAERVLAHFVRHGMKEGRSGNAEFNVYAYKNNYSDLRAVFGDDLEEYYIHYLEYGREEGRSCALVAVTTYRGVDYSAVYNFEYYIGRYPDLSAVFENNPTGALQHFVESGINEDRQACESFNIVAYKNNNEDLRRAFGDNNRAYVEHYMCYGINEPRNATSIELHRIAGEDSADAEQMAKYFLANASYPTYYANNTNIHTIREFCELYVSECNAEGIDVAVAFCQAMKETNFLRFTGDVKISQFNFAGLGATGNGVSGLSFSDIQTGIRAHVQHLKAYANNYSLVNPCVDSRFAYVTRGSAQFVEWLGKQENPIPGCGWATAPGYGTSIVNDFMNKLSTY